MYVRVFSAAALAAGLFIQTPSFAQLNPAAATDSDPEKAPHENWRAMLAKNPVTTEGCFHASYPNFTREQVQCEEAGQPRFHPMPAKSTRGLEEFVGNTQDYVAQSSGLISSALGKFNATGVTSVTSVGVPSFGNAGNLGANKYTLQINTNNDEGNQQACESHPNCRVWQQFVYSIDYIKPGEAAVFMQYWLYNWGTSSCPKSGGWQKDVAGGVNCWSNSTLTVAPDVPITELSNLSLSAVVTPGGMDIVEFSTGTEVFTRSAKDSVLNIASAWYQAEFNVLGDGGGSQAEFNSGSTITVGLIIDDGSQSAPACLPPNYGGTGYGTTGETNNLALSSCISGVFGNPYIEFTEFLLKPFVPVVPIGLK